MVIQLLIVVAMVTMTQATSPCPLINNSNTTYTINMKGTGLTTLNRTLFEAIFDCNTMAGNITRIDSSGNSINHVEYDTFGIFYSLIRLDLSYNEISHLHVNTFNGLRTLQELDVSFNQLTQLQAGLIQILSLVSVWFNNNNISYVEPGIVGQDNEELIYFNMDYNALTYLDPWPYLTYQTHSRDVTRNFYLRHNNISMLTNYMNWTYDLIYSYEVEVSVEHNDIRSVGSNAVLQYDHTVPYKEILPRFLTLYANITNNPFYCDCNLYLFAEQLRSSILRYSRVEEYRYRCNAPSKVAGIDWLHDLDMAELVCNTTNDCPSNCQCQDRPHNDTYFIDCTGAGLTEIPDIIPENNRSKIEIFLDNNYITELKSTSYIDRIYNISLRNNEITTLDNDVLEQLNAKEIDFGNNKIRSLPVKIKKYGYDSVNLHGNRLWCDCDTMWYQDWLNSVDSNLIDTALTCDSDEGSQTIAKMSLRDLGCTNEIVIIVGVLAGTVFFAIIIGLVFACRCPYETKVIFNKLTLGLFHPRDKYKVTNDKDKKEVDIYLVYDDDDEDVVGWVRYFLKKLNDRKSKFSILNPGRFMEPGSPAVTIPKWIGKSKRVVVVLSEGIFNNDRCDMEINDAERRLIEAASQKSDTNNDSVSNDINVELNDVNAVDVYSTNGDETEINQGEDDNNLQNAPKVIYIKYNGNNLVNHNLNEDRLQLKFADFNANMGEHSKWQAKLKEEPWKSRLAKKRVLTPDEKMFWAKLRYELPSKGTGTGEDGNFVPPAYKEDDSEIDAIRNVQNERHGAALGFELEIDNEVPDHSVRGKSNKRNQLRRNTSLNTRTRNEPFKNSASNGNRNKKLEFEPSKDITSTANKNKKLEFLKLTQGNNVKDRVNFLSGGGESSLGNLASNITQTLEKSRKKPHPPPAPLEKNSSHLQYSRTMNSGVTLGKNGMILCEDNSNTKHSENRCPSAASSVTSSALFSEC
ncbi:hypothetical protein ACF0H5_007914 [Mactra antiquata]